MRYRKPHSKLSHTTCVLIQYIIGCNKEKYWNNIIDNKAIKINPPAKPSKPSIKLNALVRQITAKIVKKYENIPNEITPTLFMVPRSTTYNPEKITKIDAII